MNPKSQRLFISSLPSDLINQEELRHQFSDYGCVGFVEVKERNNRTRTDKSRHFAYVTIEADDRSLQKCLHEFNSKGIEVQIAKESFMDRLKREREETASNKPKPEAKQNTNVKRTKVKVDEIEIKQDRLSNDYADSVPCRKRKKRLEEKGAVEVLMKETDGMKMEAEKKRLQSISQMKKEYQHQKSVIQAALSNIATSSKKKTIFFDDAEPTSTSFQSPSKDKTTLFDDDNDEDDGEEYDFSHKEHLEGEKGGRLMVLQSKFKHDRRFAMNERFLDSESESEANEIEHNKQPEPGAVDSYDEEKRMERGILEGILGQAIVKKPKDTAPNTMLRFDPTKPEHSQYEVAKEITKLQSKKKKAEPKTITEETRAEVSKEQFYKVESNLKEALQDNQQFSLLDMFGSSENKTTGEGASTSKAGSTNVADDRNPFVYDSSESEDESEQQPKPPPKARSGMAWAESMFFKENDYRMQEGLEFIKRLKCDEEDDFSVMRRNLKVITRAKVRNTLRNNRPFKHKLGSKKRIKVKRALKR